MDKHATQPPGGDDLIERLEGLLAGVPAPLEPLDISALDGYLCGVLLRGEALSPPLWQPGVLDIDGRPSPAGFDAAPLMRLVEHRFRELNAAIEARRWFDPWVFEIDDARLSPAQQVQPWVSGLTLALERFPGAPAASDPQAQEPLGLLYSMFDAGDLEDEPALEGLRPVIESMEPPADLEEAVEDLVRSVLLLADVVRPLPRRRPAARRRPR